MTYSERPYGDDLYGGSEDLETVQNLIVAVAAHAVSSGNVVLTRIGPATLIVPNGRSSVSSSNVVLVPPSEDVLVTNLVWDNVGDRVYETGLDRGVLYLSDGSAVPWNGLTSIVEKFDKETVPVYYDGMKINELVSLGDFSATMKAMTYPDEFVEIEGLGKLSDGLFVGDQKPKTFGLCYRTKIGNDVEGNDAGYKIHLLYNVTAIPNDKTYETMGESLSPVEFEWNITAVPEEIPGFRPTAHIIINTIDFDPRLLEEVEGMLYGSDTDFAALIPMSDLISFMSEWYRITPPEPHEIYIVDNGDGTWSATTDIDGLITVDIDGNFEIRDANAIFAGDHYRISDTVDD